MRREPKKFNHQAVIDAYHRGAADRLARKPPTPPKKGLARKAYLNGYHQC